MGAWLADGSLAQGWELGSRMGAWLEDGSLLRRESGVIVKY